MQHDLLAQTALKDISAASDLKVLQDLKVRYLGKKGEVTSLLKSLKDLDENARRQTGAAINALRDTLEAAFSAAEKVLVQKSTREEEAKTALDVTLPGRHMGLGSYHPISRCMRRIEEIFANLGYDVHTGPEVETEYYNFDALNVPAHHPARAMHDTFYFNDGRLLRTQTSPVQIRTMEKISPPIRIIAPGRVYRCDYDMTHIPMFHQVEGLFIDKGVTFAHLKGVLKHFLENFFETTLQMRLRPSYFPFTEPSAEVDITCVHCKGAGCPSCKGTGWLEVLGAGMVHPTVLEAGNIDPTIYSGFAFGCGIDRLAMLRYKIKDIRQLYDHDLRFFRAFGE